MRTRFWPSMFAFALMVSITQAIATPFAPNVIYGEDDRLDYYQVADARVRATADSTVALIRAANLTQHGAVTNINSVPYGQGMGLCPGEPFFNQETAAFCSGFLVSPDTIVTAGHCIANQNSCLNTRFVFGFRLDQKDVNPRSVPSAQVYSCSQVVHTVSQPQGEDFAVVKLDRMVTGFTPLAYRTTGKVSAGAALFVVGHPAGLPTKISGGAQVRSVGEQFLVANLDTYGGNSGSAVFNSVTGEVEGILVRGEMDFVLQDGCRKSNVCADEACRGEDVTLFERVLPYLEQ